MKVTYKPKEILHPAALITGSTFICSDALYHIIRDNTGNNALVVNLETGVYYLPRDFTGRLIKTAEAEVIVTKMVSGS